MELGLAYYYRGHFIYAYPAGTPIEPIAYSTRRGISIVGIALDQAPRYNAFATNLVAEDSIGALKKACKNEAILQQQRKEEQESETPEVSQQSKEDKRAKSAPENNIKQADVPSVYVSDADKQSENHARSKSASSTEFLKPLPSVPRIHSSAYTPHDRAQFLAYSAPASRYMSTSNSPHASRPVSPSKGTEGSGLLRSVASASKLSHLLAEEEERRRAFSPLSEVPEGKSARAVGSLLKNNHKSNHRTEDPSGSEESNPSPARPSKPTPALFLPGLGHIDSSAAPRELRSVPAFPATRGEMRNGRPETASLALNQAYNAANARCCPIHGETCDGKTITELRLTERAREGKGFKEEDYPVLVCGDGSVLVDWAKLLVEGKGM